MRQPTRYDGLASWYDEFIRSVDHTAITLEVLERLLGPGSGRCLDLGCGTGIAFPTLARLGWSIVGVDISNDQLAVARSRVGSSDVELLCADATRLPFEDQSFDAVVSLLTHTDLDDPAAAFREAARVLRPGGRFVYVGIHPCFWGPNIGQAGKPGHPNAGYRRQGWDPRAQGPIRDRVGASHVSLANLVNTMLDAPIRLDRLEEPGTDDPPLLLAFRGERLRP